MGSLRVKMLKSPEEALRLSLASLGLLESTIKLSLNGRIEPLCYRCKLKYMINCAGKEREAKSVRSTVYFIFSTLLKIVFLLFVCFYLFKMSFIFGAK